LKRSKIILLLVARAKSKPVEQELRPVISIAQEQGYSPSGIGLGAPAGSASRVTVSSMRRQAGRRIKEVSRHADNPGKTAKV